MNILHSAAVAAVLAVAPLSASASVILQPEGPSGSQIEIFSPIGQSFTAIGDRLVAFAFMFSDVNDSLPNLDLTVSIFAGTDIAAPALASASQLLTPGLVDTFVDFAFDLGVTVGAVYTATVTDQNARWFVQSTELGSVYDGGAFLIGGAFRDDADAAFRATFAPIPAPAALPLLASGFGLLGALVLRRRRA